MTLRILGIDLFRKQKWTESRQVRYYGAAVTMAALPDQVLDRCIGVVMPEAPMRHSLLGELDALADGRESSSVVLDSALDRVLRALDCQVGTIHGLDSGSGLLTLLASRGVPETLLARIVRIPIGKGMAGIAAERREPVQVCNLQTDTSGVAKPSARETRMEGSIAVPILHGDELRGTLGVAKPVPYEFTVAESALLLNAGAVIARLMA
jgi:L-methionine (R)-S-oxide reductase